MTAILIIIAAALLFAVIAKTKNTTVSVSHNFGDADIRELICEYLSLKLKSVNVLKPKKGGDNGEPAVQDCKKQ
ncbi:MAG: hypothetical protein IKP68_04865 [Clostridia bacterium]|nr:hypothetical protein [Clostridia bacterium]